MVLDLAERRVAARPRLDDGGHLLAPTLVGRADHDGVEHVRMGAHRGLDLFGEDLLAARVDADRTASEEGDAAVRLDGGEVTGHHVAAAVHGDEHIGRLLGVVVVADRDVTCPGDLADDARAGLDRSQLLVEHDGLAEDADGGAALHGRGSFAHHGHPVVAGLRRAHGVGDEDVRKVLEEGVLDWRREEGGR